ncbi:MAG: hypothetical protein ABSD74_14050 [Rhizomicrobium sp.]
MLSDLDRTRKNPTRVSEYGRHFLDRTFSTVAAPYPSLFRHAPLVFRNGFNRLGRLITLSAGEFQTMTGASPGEMRRIKRLLAIHGLKFSSFAPGWTTPDIEVDAASPGPKPDTKLPRPGLRLVTASS